MIIVNDIESLWLWWDEQNEEVSDMDVEIPLVDQIWDTVQELCTICWQKMFGSIKRLR